MDWLSIAHGRKVPTEKVDPSYAGGLAGDVVIEGDAVLSLGSGIRAIQLSPSHAGLAGRRRKRLRTAPASTACCCPVGLSTASKPLTQRSFLPNLSCLRQGSHRLVMRRTLIAAPSSPATCRPRDGDVHSRTASPMRSSTSVRPHV